MHAPVRPVRVYFPEAESSSRTGTASTMHAARKISPAFNANDRALARSLSVLTGLTDQAGVMLVRNLRIA